VRSGFNTCERVKIVAQKCKQRVDCPKVFNIWGSS
jgi:hypothetical protein